MHDYMKKVKNQKNKMSQLNMRDYVTSQIGKKQNNSIGSTYSLLNPVMDIDQAKLSKSNRQYKFIEEIDLILDENENKYEDWVKKSFIDQYDKLRENPCYMRDAVQN